MATYKNPWYVPEISIKLLNNCLPKITKKKIKKTHFFSFRGL